MILIVHDEHPAIIMLFGSNGAISIIHEVKYFLSVCFQSG